MSACAAVWKVATRTRPSDGVAARGDRRLGALELAEDRLGVRDEGVRRRREADAAADRLEQRHADFAGEDRQLVRHGRGVVAERRGDRRQGAAMMQLAEQPEPRQIVHGVLLS
ncbi:hypothetical protein JOD46_000254 [Agromyces aurantiacus]|nr:hypothetical protein [Agromyces aurantiacus]MBM7502797.1 hypothetical protein [Agromyces aurantiacus]